MLLIVIKSRNKEQSDLFYLVMYLEPGNRIRTSDAFDFGPIKVSINEGLSSFLLEHPIDCQVWKYN